MSSTPSPGDGVRPGLESGPCARLMILALTALLATACGQRGPLYLPDDSAAAPVAAETELVTTDNDPNLEDEDEETPGA